MSSNYRFNSLSRDEKILLYRHSYHLENLMANSVLHFNLIKIPIKYIGSSWLTTGHLVTFEVTTDLLRTTYNPVDVPYHSHVIAFWVLATSPHLHYDQYKKGCKISLSQVVIPFMTSMIFYYRSGHN